jgi:hypothetical protein
MAHTLVFSHNCPNCQRFLGALEACGPANAQVRRLDVASMNPSDLNKVKAVPTMFLNNGQVLVGKSAFDWLKQFDGQCPLEGFELVGSHGLPFSHWEDTQATMGYSTSWGPFEPVP